MRIHVETELTNREPGRLRRIRLDGRDVEIVETADQWAGTDYCYFKVRDVEGNVYIVRHDEPRDEWELTMFARSDAPSDSSERDLRKLLH